DYKYLIFFIFSSCRSEDTVDQPDKHVTEVEGRSVELKCKYKTDSTQDDLFWYIQRANDFPKYILRRSKYGGDNGTEFQERFHSKLSSNSVPLTIKNLRVSDSAVYYCALRVGAQYHSVLILRLSLYFFQMTVSFITIPVEFMALLTLQQHPAYLILSLSLVGFYFYGFASDFGACSPTDTQDIVIVKSSPPKIKVTYIIYG
uniref:Ig-like domain-containing protein n=1 Tax=Cyprinus carpio TaxID=7962 RepID=A0A8C1RZP6_CYPCA